MLGFDGPPCQVIGVRGQFVDARGEVRGGKEESAVQGGQGDAYGVVAGATPDRGFLTSFFIRKSVNEALGGTGPHKDGTLFVVVVGPAPVKEGKLGPVAVFNILE
jgi:hypothetical protein